MGGALKHLHENVSYFDRACRHADCQRVGGRLQNKGLGRRLKQQLQKRLRVCEEVNGQGSQTRSLGTRQRFQHFMAYKVHRVGKSRSQEITVNTPINKYQCFSVCRS